MIMWNSGEYVAPLSHLFELDLDLKLRHPTLSEDEKYPSPRTPSIVAPWEEPPCPDHNTTFDYFPLLPSAVRKRIWKLALPGPLVIEIQYKNKQHRFRAPAPTILYVNREARETALTEYEFAAASPINHLDSALGHQYLAFVNFRLDTFCPSISFRSFITGEWKTFLRGLSKYDKIERFGLPIRCFQFPNSACIPLLLRYKSLREVVVLADPCTDHLPNVNDGKGEGWCLGPGIELPTLETAGKSGREEVLDNYSVQFMDTVRKAWKVEHDWDLRFVYKGVCWGGKCWEESEESEKGTEKRTCMDKKAVKRMMTAPRRNVAKVLMLIM